MTRIVWGRLTLCCIVALCIASLDVASSQASRRTLPQQSNFLQERLKGLKGLVQKIDVDGGSNFGTVVVSDTRYLRGVDFGKQFYVIYGDGVQLLDGPVFTAEPRSKSGKDAWLKWYENIVVWAGCMWKPYNNVGHGQVNLSVSRDGKFLDLDIHGYAPGVDSNGKFIFSKANEEQFRRAVLALVRSMEGKKALRFPEGSKAKSVALTLKFSTDADAVVHYTDLVPLALAPQDERTQRLIRIADVLDSGWYEKAADAVRMRLPKYLRERLVNGKGHHGFLAMIDGDPICAAFGEEPLSEHRLNIMRHEADVTAVLNGLMNAGKYAAADDFAKKVVFTSFPGGDPKAAAEKLARIIDTAGGASAIDVIPKNVFAVSKFSAAGNMATNSYERRPARSVPQVEAAKTESETSVERLQELNEQIRQHYKTNNLQQAKFAYEEVLAILAKSKANPPVLIQTAKRNYASLCERLKTVDAPVAVNKLPVRAAPNADQIGIVGLKFVLSVGRGCIVSRVFPNTPAHLAHIRPDDRIEAVDGMVTTNKDREQIYQMLTGAPGSTVTLQLTRSNGQREIVKCVRMRLGDVEDPLLRRDYEFTRP